MTAIITKNKKLPKHPSAGEWINQIHIGEYYSPIKKEKEQTTSTYNMDKSKCIMLTERRQILKATY